MKIVGHGIDLVDLPTFQKTLDNSETSFTSRSFTDSEIVSFGEGINRTQKIAGRFAAKEAVLKALGTGFGNGVAFKDIVIERANGCPPTVSLTGGAANIADKLGVTEWWLSISHSEIMAIASVIAVSDRGK